MLAVPIIFYSFQYHEQTSCGDKNYTLHSQDILHHSINLTVHIISFNFTFLNPKNQSSRLFSVKAHSQFLPSDLQGFSVSKV